MRNVINTNSKENPNIWNSCANSTNRCPKIELFKLSASFWSPPHLLADRWWGHWQWWRAPPDTAGTHWLLGAAPALPQLVDLGSKSRAPSRPPSSCTVPDRLADSSARSLHTWDVVKVKRMTTFLFLNLCLETHLVTKTDKIGKKWSDAIRKEVLHIRTLSSHISSVNPKPPRVTLVLSVVS